MSTQSEALKIQKTPLGRTLTESQEAAIDALYEGNKLLIAPKGFGKAVVGQTAAQALVHDGFLRRVLVLAPLKVCQLTWAQEFESWEHLNPPGMMIGSERERRRVLHDDNWAVTVTNFDNLAWLFKQFPNGDRFPFDGLLVDESTKLKSAGSTGFRALRRAIKWFRWRCAMTADPIAEIGVDIYTQAMLADNGAALGRNLEAFRRKYFYPTDFQQRKWAILPGRDKALADVLQDVLYVVRDDAYEAALPPVVDKIVTVDMPREAWGVYNALDSGAVELDDGGVIIADGAAAVVNKRQQVTAGAVYDMDGVAHWLHTAKLEALEKAISQAREPLAIGYLYKFELAALKERWPDLVVLGDNPVAVESAWNAGAVRLMAVHPDSCAHGLNLQYGGSRLHVLSMPWGADPWEQLIGRFRRRGQRAAEVERVIYLVEDTVDAEILARHAQKRYASTSLNQEFN
jgi:SNF2-related domain